MSFQEREDVISDYYSFQPQRSITNVTNTFNIGRSAGRKPGKQTARDSTVTVRKKKIFFGDSINKKKHIFLKKRPRLTHIFIPTKHLPCAKEYRTKEKNRKEKKNSRNIIHRAVHV